MKTAPLLVLSLMLMLFSCKPSQKKIPDAGEAFVIEKGLNVSHWLSQTTIRGEERAAYMSAKDFEKIAEMGFDHVRIPIDEEHMWDEEGLELLEEFVQPVPELFRDVARESISSKIGEIALLKESDTITRDILIEGYIVGTPKRDHKFLRKTLKDKEIDVTPFEEFFHLSKKEYNLGWEQKYKEQKRMEKKTSTN